MGGNTGMRVLLVEGSALARALFLRAAKRIPDLTVLGTDSRAEALEKAAAFNPDVVCLGPRLSDGRGEAFLKAFRAISHRPVLAFGSCGPDEAELGEETLALLDAGADDLLSPPVGNSPDDPEWESYLRAHLFIAARRHGGAQPPERNDPQKPLFEHHRMLILGGAMGSLGALARLVAGLPKELPLPMVAVVPVCEAMFPAVIQWLANKTGLAVQAAHHGEAPMAGTLYLASPLRHLMFGPDGCFVTSSQMIHGGAPSLDIAIESAAGFHGQGLVAVILSGEGEDGCPGLRALQSASGLLIVQDPPSALADTLPRSVLGTWTVGRVLSPGGIRRMLLATTEEAVKRMPPGRETAASLEPGQITLLIVEDSPIQALMLKRILTGAGYMVHSAPDGAKGLSLAREVRPHLIVSDISMPIMDGFEMCARLKNDVELKPTPIILLTALSHPNEILQGLEAGADNYITKPYDEAYLLERIGYLLARPPMSEEKPAEVLEITFEGRRFAINSNRQQILTLLLSTYQNAVRQNRELLTAQMELRVFNEKVVEHASRMLLLNERLAKEVESRAALQEKQGRLLEELESSNRELKEFAYVVSHDLKAPLRAIGSLVQWLAEDLQDKLGEDGREQMGLLINRVNRMHNLIEGILQYSRIGRMKEERVEVRLDKLLSHILDSLSPPEGIRIHLPADLPVIRGEKVRIQQVFQNLLSNSLKYMGKEEGEVFVSWSDEGEAWRFEVRDTGPGIDPRYHEKIFQIFQTLHARDEFESTGIGLTLVKKIVELHGGRVWVDSDVGRGASFFFTLPKAPPES